MRKTTVPTWCSCSAWRCWRPSDTPDRAGWRLGSLPPTENISEKVNQQRSLSWAIPPCEKIDFLSTYLIRLFSINLYNLMADHCSGTTVIVCLCLCACACVRACVCVSACLCVWAGNQRPLTIPQAFHWVVHLFFAARREAIQRERVLAVSFSWRLLWIGLYLYWSLSRGDQGAVSAQKGGTAGPALELLWVSSRGFISRTQQPGG